ncbi:hypothetical protein E4T56_gene5244, partial [Termitomyces sp. T112]
MDLGLQDVHVLVTGANGGIGLEITNVFLQQGAKVTAHYNSSDKSLEPLIAQYKDRAQAFQADLTIETAVSHLFNYASSSFGPVQIIIV